MKKSNPAVPAAPTVITVAALPAETASNLRVVDAATGDTIARVIEADAEKGTVRRFEVEDGNLVRDGDSFKIVEEERKIRIEWIDPPVAGDDAAADEGAA